ncbi:MAG: amidophosphoribosyltransferase [Spirochaetia bacterium]|nr:amidophosphoribosyltransferase [Spirochaetia bacterium]
MTGGAVSGNFDGKKEACGIFGILGTSDASYITHFGLQALQHRGEEAAGIASTDGRQIHLHAAEGHVREVFQSEATLAGLKGFAAIGHTRYSITGAPCAVNVQPLVVDLVKGRIAVAHNGNLTNSVELKEELEKNGSIFQSSIDTELVLHLIAKSKKENIKDAIIEALLRLEGSYALVILTNDTLYAARDAKGFKPLCLGDLGGVKVVASETSAFDLVGATYTGQVLPGELVTITRGGVEREIFAPKAKQTSCIFELIYFARPDSLVFDESVYNFRKELGRVLAREAPADADIVVPVPDSGVNAALGFAEATGIPYEPAIIRNHYVGRSFIQPSEKLREAAVRIKLNPIKHLIQGKRVVIVDDSVVRGTTTRERVRSLRAAGAKEVHMRVSCPPIKHGCYYGIDFPDEKKLIANLMNVADTAKYLNLDSLAYISLDGMIKAASGVNGFCDACFTGNYPTRVDKAFSKDALERSPQLELTPAN